MFGVALLIFLLTVSEKYFLTVIPLIFVNEKIAIIGFLFLAIRCATSREDRHLLRSRPGMVMLAMIAYAGAILLLHATGNAYQLTPSGYLANLVNNVKVNLSLRGVLLSWTPSILMLALALIGRYDNHSAFFSRRDGLLIPAMMLVALTLTQDFQVGRIVMMAMPIFAIPAAERLSGLMDDGLGTGLRR